MNKWLARGISILALPLVGALFILSAILEIMLRMAAKDGDEIPPLHESLGEAFETIVEFYRSVWAIE